MPKGFACRVERHSISPRGREMFSAVIRFPRVMLAEAITHRTISESWGECEVACTERATTIDLSKNSASSRAIPFPRMLASVMADPYIPPWTMNQKGMQGATAEDEAVINKATKKWLEALTFNANAAQYIFDLGIHKQDANRLLEPWGWVTQIVTADDIAWNNFFALRCHEAAYPSFRTIARMLYLAKRRSKPTPLDYGQWHLPFVPEAEALKLRWVPEPKAWTTDLPLPDLVRHSAARCAWISYENHDKDGSAEAMDRTFATLIGGFPKHASPIEHQGTPMHLTWEASYPELRSNIRGWVQGRKLVRMENVEQFCHPEDEVRRWGIDESKLWNED